MTILKVGDDEKIAQSYLERRDLLRERWWLRELLRRRDDGELRRRSLDRECLERERDRRR